MRGLGTFLALAKKKKRVVYVGYNYRHHPQLIAIKKMIDAGKLGKIFFARFTTGEYLPGWHPWEDYRKGYAARSDLGGGMLLTQSHDIDTALWFFGTPGRVMGRASKSGILAVTSDDTADLILGYNTFSVQIHLDGLMQPPVKQCEIYGLKGTILWDYHKGTLTTTIKGHTTQNRLKHFDRNDMYIKELKDFLSCVKSHQAPSSDGAAGAQVVAIAETISKNSTA